MKSSWIQLAVCAATSSLALAQTSARRPDLPKLLDEWRAAHGAGWQIDVDQNTGHLEMLYGARVEPVFKPRDDAEWFTLARQALADTQAMHGIAGATLVEHHALFLPLGQFGSGDKMTLRFRQQLHGVPVEAGFVNVLFDAAGGLLSIQEHALPLATDFGTQPALTASTARDFALAAFDREFARTPTSLSDAELVIAQVEAEEERVPVLAWRVTALWEVDGEAVGRTYWIDAASGRVAQWENAIHHFDVGGTLYTKATPGAYPDSNANPETQQVMRYARVTSSAGTRTTDANGNFNYAGVNGPLSITAFYDGTFNDVNNSAGSPYTLVQSVTGTGNSIVMNDTPTASVTAQANVFVAVNALRDWTRSINSGDAQMDFVATANTNIASTCNAYFNGTSTNYYQSGGSCANTAYSSIVYHETGHWLNVRYGTGNGSDGMGEGNADVFAMYIQDDPVVGHDFCGVGCNVRSGTNLTQFCGDATPACYGEVHTDGLVWMGAAWKVRRNLKNTLGDAAGIALSNLFFNSWLNSYNQTQIRSVIETQWLTLDDNDGNLTNGTPHLIDIDRGFGEHGFPRYVQLSFNSVADLPDTLDQIGPYVVDANLSSTYGASVTSATLRWRTGSFGGFASVPMNPIGGNVWRASIPGVAAPNKVYYFVEAADNAGNAGSFPADAPIGKIWFGVGVPSVISCENFDVGAGWSVSNDASVTAGAWVRGDPVGTTAQPETDNPAGTGTQCYFTGQGSVGGSVSAADLDGGPTTLTSPVIDMSGGDGEIAFAYWLYNDDGDDSLVVEVTNDGSTWKHARTFTGGAGGWMNGLVDVGTWVLPTSTVRVRFIVADSPNNSVTECAIDDVCASVLGPTACGSAATYCTAKTNSLGCVPAVSTSGTASATSPSPFDVSVAQVLNNKSVLLFYGSGQSVATFQGGTLCVHTPLRRTPLSDTGGNAGPDDCSGSYTYDFNARIQSGVDANLVVGATVNAQFYYRDPADAFTVGLSNGAQFQICP